MPQERKLFEEMTEDEKLEVIRDYYARRASEEKFPMDKKYHQDKEAEMIKRLRIFRIDSLDE